jgi:hypothetical protein
VSERFRRGADETAVAVSIAGIEFAQSEKVKY